jgi:hypothetical protein
VSGGYRPIKKTARIFPVRERTIKTAFLGRKEPFKERSMKFVWPPRGGGTNLSVKTFSKNPGCPRRGNREAGARPNKETQDNLTRLERRGFATAAFKTGKWMVESGK